MCIPDSANICAAPLSRYASFSRWLTSSFSPSVIAATIAYSSPCSPISLYIPFSLALCVSAYRARYSIVPVPSVCISALQPHVSILKTPVTNTAVSSIAVAVVACRCLIAGTIAVRASNTGVAHSAIFTPVSCNMQETPDTSPVIMPAANIVSASHKGRCIGCLISVGSLRRHRYRMSL